MKFKMKSSWLKFQGSVSVKCMRHGLVLCLGAHCHCQLNEAFNCLATGLSSAFLRAFAAFISWVEWVPTVWPSVLGDWFPGLLMSGASWLQEPAPRLGRVYIRGKIREEKTKRKEMQIHTQKHIFSQTLNENDFFPPVKYNLHIPF